MKSQADKVRCVSHSLKHLVDEVNIFLLFLICEEIKSNKEELKCISFEIDVCVPCSYGAISFDRGNWKYIVFVISKIYMATRAMKSCVINCTLSDLTNYNIASYQI